MCGKLQSGRDWGCLLDDQVVFIDGHFLVNFLRKSMRQSLGNQELSIWFSLIFRLFSYMLSLDCLLLGLW